MTVKSFDWNCDDGFRQLLLLMHAALTGSTKCCTTNGGFEWDKVFAYANEQTVLGMLFQTVDMLPKDCRPDRMTLFQLIGNAEIIRQRNVEVNEALRQLVDELKDDGVDAIVVKGQVVGLEYQEPGLRQSGDIDVFVDSSQWEPVERWIERNNIRYKRRAAEKHIEIEYNGVNVELHYHLNVFSSGKLQRYWLNEIENKALCNSREVRITMPDCDNRVSVRTLDVNATIAHLLVHVHHHLLTEGVGLRQLMDMCLFLKNHIDEIDCSLLKRHLEGIGHYKAFTAYCALMNKYLGLPKDSVPFELNLNDYVYADRIMEEVWRGGNFGHKNNLKGVKPGLLHSMNTAVLVLKHSLRFYRLAPAEARGYWWNKIFWRMKRKSS